MTELGLRAVGLADEYRSDRADLVRDFYLPALAQARRYDRAVGYFNGALLALIGHGLDQFAQRGGTMRLIASPLLNPDDVDDIEHGYEVREVLKRAALRELAEASEDGAAAVSLGRLGQLVAEGRLDIKLAFVDAPGRVGVYHEKIGAFYDGHDAVVFKGSANETQQGLQGNFESVEVFRSWVPGDESRAARIIRDFNDLWADRTELLRVVAFTEVARPFLEELAREQAHTPMPPVPRIDGAGIVVPAVPVSSVLSIPADLTIRDYQREAVRAWFRNQGRGILRMATGTGKTITALCAAAQLVKHLSATRDQPLLTVVVVPLQHLVDQWADDVRRFGAAPVRAYHSVTSWHPLVGGMLDALNLGAAGGGVIVTTNATFGGEAFQDSLARCQQPILLIADEVHNLGAQHLRYVLPEQAMFRLGLSATPERWFDDVGTEALGDYFGPVVYELGLGDAIELGALCPYRYVPVLVELDEAEMSLYGDLSAKIAKLIAVEGFSEEAEEDTPLGMLLRKRAHVLGHAQGKVAALIRELKARRDEWYQLVYCAEGRRPTEFGTADEPSQLQQVLAVVGNTLGLTAAPYTGETPREERRRLLRRFGSGQDLRVLLSMRCLDEGVDVPEARVAYLLASSTNPRQFIQRRGRVLRRAEGKTSAEIVDFIVTPPLAADVGDDVERKLMGRELQRVAEFARLATNSGETLDVLRPLRMRYGLMDV